MLHQATIAGHSMRGWPGFAGLVLAVVLVNLKEQLDMLLIDRKDIVFAAVSLYGHISEREERPIIVDFIADTSIRPEHVTHADASGAT